MLPRAYRQRTGSRTVQLMRRQGERIVARRLRRNAMQPRRWSSACAWVVTLAASVTFASWGGSGRVSAQQAAPRLRLQPTTGPAGTKMLARGSSFVASPCGVNVYLDSIDGPLLGSFATEQRQRGSFRGDIIIPAGTASGQHRIIAQGLLDGEKSCRSEERRVGKSVDLGGRRIMK